MTIYIPAHSVLYPESEVSQLLEVTQECPQRWRTNASKEVVQAGTNSRVARSPALVPCDPEAIFGRSWAAHRPSFRLKTATFTRLGRWVVLGEGRDGVGQGGVMDGWVMGHGTVLRAIGSALTGRKGVAVLWLIERLVSINIQGALSLRPLKVDNELKNWLHDKGFTLLQIVSFPFFC